MMEISEAITRLQQRAHCRQPNGLICNWEREMSERAGPVLMRVEVRMLNVINE